VIQNIIYEKLIQSCTNQADDIKHITTKELDYAIYNLSQQWTQLCRTSSIRSKSKTEVENQKKL